MCPRPGIKPGPSFELLHRIELCSPVYKTGASPLMLKKRFNIATKAFLVGVRGLKPPASRSQTERSIN